MTGGPRPPEGTHRPPAILQPRVFFPLLIAVIAISVLFAPRETDLDQEPSLSMHSSAPLGASGLADALQRLGWQVTAMEQPLSDTLSADAIYAVLVPEDALTIPETHLLLDRVRAGAGLLVIAGDGALSDSLHIGTTTAIGPVRRQHDDTASCGDMPRTFLEIASSVPMYLPGLQARGPMPKDTVDLAVSEFASRRASAPGRPVVLGVPLGRGRIAVVSSGRLLANDVIRQCRWGAGITATRVVEWLSVRDGTARRRVVFDEYHQGYGPHASVTGAIAHWLAKTPSGRTGAQIAIAALLLLAAFAPRAVPPVPKVAIARRSPLEHVAALAQAYERVRATRTTALRLVQGVRRRSARAGLGRRGTDEDFLAAIAARTPSIALDVERVRHALNTTISPSELMTASESIDRIERSLHQ